MTRSDLPPSPAEAYKMIGDLIEQERQAATARMANLADLRGHILRELVEEEQPGGLARAGRKAEITPTQVGRSLTKHLAHAIKAALKEGGWKPREYTLNAASNAYPPRVQLALLWDGNEPELERLNQAGGLMFTLREAGMTVLTEEMQGLDVDGYGPRSELADGNEVTVYWTDSPARQ